jgi:hypothetical protein
MMTKTKTGLYRLFAKDDNYAGPTFETVQELLEYASTEKGWADECVVIQKRAYAPWVDVISVHELVALGEDSGDEVRSPDPL